MFGSRPARRLTLRTFSWSAAPRSDAGRIRPDNEDASFASIDDGVFIVADGMGGRAAGEVASGIVCRVIGTAASEASGTIDGLRSTLNAAFHAAGEEIARQVAQDPSRAGMGTTCTVLLLNEGGDYLIGHIGDSRAYLMRGRTLVRVTRDHSWVQDQIDRGLIKPEEARGHPSSNLITRAIGVDALPTPDLYAGALQDDDLFLLASDGLTDMVSDQRIAELLASRKTPGDLAEGLVAEANEAGGSDNITVLVVRIRRLEP